MSLSGECPFWMFGSSREAPHMSGSARETLPDVPEWLRGPPRCSVAPTGCLVVVGWPSRMSESGQEAFPDVREWSGGPSEYPGVVGRPSRMSGRGRKTLQDVWKWSGGPPKCPGVVGRYSRMSLSVERPFWMYSSCREAPGCP